MRGNKFLNIFGIVFMVLFALTAAAQPSKPGRFKDSVAAKKFYRGNLHTHTSDTDGDAPPAQVIKWYKNNGYDFVSITDHDILTVTPPGLTDEKFITLNGVELTGLAAHRAPVHVNAICGKGALKGIRTKEPVLDVLKSNIALSRNDGAITMVNHPNFGWALKQADLLGATGFELLEVASGHPLVNDDGDEKDFNARPSAQTLWDMYLTKVGPLFGVAVDDSHNYHKFGPKMINPGRAWINVWAAALTNDSVCEAIRKGHFYAEKVTSKSKTQGAQKGIGLKSLAVSSNAIELTFDHWPVGSSVNFIGADGKVLQDVTANPARYILQGGETYVRAYINKHSADVTQELWTQAYFVSYE